MGELLTLSHAAVSVLWEDLALGDLPTPFGIRSVGATMDERATIRRNVWKDLTDRGLAYRDRLEPDVEDQLTILTRYDSAISVFGALGEDRVLRARVSGNSRCAVLAVQGPKNVHIEPIAPNRLVASVVGLLPDARPFPGRPVTVRDDPPERSGYLRPADASNRDDEQARRMLACRRERTGYFTAYARDHRERLAQSVELAWTDTVKGRFISRMRADRRATTHAPATSSSLMAELRVLLAGVRADD